VILDRYRETNSLSPYCRVLLALRLELELQESARRRKAREGTPLSSNLTKQERTDVRKEIARISGVSLGTSQRLNRSWSRRRPKFDWRYNRGSFGFTERGSGEDFQLNDNRKHSCSTPVVRASRKSSPASFGNMSKVKNRTSRRSKHWLSC